MMLAMKRLVASRFFAAAVVVVAGAIIFSPLIATVLHSSSQSNRTSLHSFVGPLGGSVGSAVVSTIVALLLGTPFAIWVDRAQPKLRRLFWAFGVLVLMVPPYIAAEGWIELLGPAGKISKPLAIWLGFGPHSTDPVEMARFVVPGFVYTWPGVGIVMGGCFFPIVALAVASTLRRTDRRVFESARLAQGRRGVLQIAAHILVPAALGAALLVFAATLTEFAVPQLLRVRTVGEAVYEQIQEGDLATAGLLSMPLLPLVVAAGGLGAFILLRARVASLASLEGEVPKFTGHSGGLMSDLRASAITLCALTPGLVLPMVSLVWLAAAAKLPPPSAIGTHKVLRASGFVDSLSGAWDLAHNDALRTILLAALAATLATAFAILLVRMASRPGWGPMLGALGAGLAVPAPIVGLGLIILWNHDWSAFVYQGLAIVVFAWFARFLPLAIFLAQGALARVPRELESAAALAGRNSIERFMSVVLPNAAPGLAAAWLATYVLCATEFGATLLIAPAGSPMLAPSVINLMRRGQNPEIAACQFLLLGVIALPLVIVACAGFLRRRMTRPETHE
jgi:iron(III) transport system permease protein